MGPSLADEECALGGFFLAATGFNVRSNSLVFLIKMITCFVGLYAVHVNSAEADNEFNREYEAQVNIAEDTFITHGIIT